MNVIGDCPRDSTMLRASELLVSPRAAKLSAPFQRRERDAAIATMRREGALLKVIAERFGLTVPRVSQICARLNAQRAPSLDYPCGHPRTPENTVINGDERGRCRECKNAAARKYWRGRT